MRPLIAKIKPASGFSQTIYIVLNILLPFLVFAFVRMHFVQLALVIMLLSKWRIFAVRPRFWPALVRANAVDVIVGLSILLFMVHTESQLVQFGWALIYIVWLVFFKPASTGFMVTLQAMIGLIAGLTALFVSWGGGPLYGLILLAGCICYLAARHFFDSFDEPHARLLSYIWGYFGSGVVWALGHWLLFYGVVAQPVLLLSALGIGMATLYYLDHYDRLSTGVRRQLVFVMGAISIIMVISLILSSGNKIV